MAAQVAPAIPRVFPVARVVSGVSAAVLAAAVLLSPLTPSLDGYSHLYGAKLLGWMLSGDAQAHQYLVYNSALLPNWLTPLLLTALSAVFPAEFALKLLVLLSLGLLAGGLWYAAGRHIEVLPIMLAFAVNHYITLGFHGFVFGTALCMWVLGIVLRHGISLTPRLQVITAVLLMAAFYCNPLPAILALTFPFAWLVSAIAAKEAKPRVLVRRLLRNIWPWIPPAILLSRFYLILRTQPEAVADTHAPVYRILHRAVELMNDGLFRISPTESDGTLFVILIGMLLASLLLYRTRSLSIPALLAAGSLLLFFLVPDGVGDAFGIYDRFLLFAVLFLAVLAASPARLPPKLLTGLAMLAALVVVVFAGEYVAGARRMAPVLAELKSATAAIPLHSTVLFLGYANAPSCKGLPILQDSVPQRHWAMAAMIPNSLVVLNNYEAESSDFPLLYRRKLGIKDDYDPASAKQTAAWSDTLQSANGANYVVSWGVPNGGAKNCATEVPPPLQKEIGAQYDLVSANDGRSAIQIWRQRAAK